MTSSSDWKAKMMNDYLKWRKAEAIPSVPDDHVETIMKEHKSQKLKAYHEKKREEVLRDNPSYYEERKEQQNERNRERNRAYHETHRDKVLETQKRYRDTHKDKLLAYRESHKEESKAYYDKHKDYYAEKQKIQRTLKKECEVCGCSVVKADFTKHLKTKKHREAIQ